MIFPHGSIALLSIIILMSYRKQKRTPSVTQAEIMLVDNHTPEKEYLEKEQ
ncbi:hypothetical protein [Brevibacillus laterosporus]|uniref:hypothetical protein n=1 Tax=Brevibacillus laterosporus TaxID=1465 RepID=UPI0019566B22|nr:hypothetical protein [Brevibacillus laterosporus]WNX30282.1 hypothetical protein RWW94_18965 [Brevibacillus laterosporus]